MNKIVLISVIALGLGTIACAAESPASKAVAPKAAAMVEPDLCGAAKLQNLVGRNKSEIPAKPAGAVWRIYCSSCAVTMDYSPARLNIVFDEPTGIIRQVKCG